MLIENLTTSYSLAERSLLGEDLLTRYATTRLLGIFQKAGVFNKSGEKYYQRELRQRLEVMPEYFRLFDALIDILERQGLVAVSQSLLVSTSSVSIVAKELELLESKQWNLLNYDLEVVSFVQSTIDLLDVCFASFVEVLRGDKSYLEVMFPGGDMSLVTAIYQGSIQTYINNLVSNLIYDQIEQQRTQKDEVQLLEVGAGTGGTTEPILQKIADHASHITYWYTDVAAGFTRVGKRKFGEQYPFLNFKKLDISKLPVDQGFEPSSVDIVICNNVLHTTHDVADTIRHAALLQPSGGVLVVNDLTKRLDFNTVSFGLTKDWWNYTDEDVRIPHSPILDTKTWALLLKALGYKDVTTQGIPGLSSHEYHQSVIIARRA